jgi:outer membrane protein insertion porin family
VSITVNKTDGNYIWLDINIVEKPRIAGFDFFGVKKSDKEDLREKLQINRGMVLTDYRKNYIVETGTQHFVDDGFLNCKTTLVLKPDTANKNLVYLDIMIDKGKKVRIEDIVIHGNKEFSAGKIRRSMKETKRFRWYNLLKSSKYLEENYEGDKQAVVARYLGKGYRDASISKDSVYRVSPNRMKIELWLNEGNKYYVRNVTWVGNTKYSSEDLSKRLGIQKGDVYNQQLMESRLYMSEQGNDISSLYMDDGYLFFQISPVEVNVDGDSIDFEMRIYEGRQATIRNVTVIGNTKTNDNVIMREIRTRPGQLFRRADVIRSQRELASLGYFDPEKIQINPKPDPYTGTVDIEYVVEERPNDQVELSGGWGAGRIVGTLGVSFNNFSTRNILNRSTWRPLPSGDGQRLSIRAQSNGLFFQSYNASFT